MSALIHSPRRSAPLSRCAHTRSPLSEHSGSVSPRPRRTVDLSALHDFDQARLRALLFRSQEHTKHDWLEAAGAMAEVRVLDSNCTGTASTQTNHAHFTIHISEAGDPVHRHHGQIQLVRPLLLGGLVEVLLRLETHFSNREDLSAFRKTPTVFEPHSKGAVDYTVSPAYRLRKWPSEKLLQRQASHNQIAKVFSAKPITIAQASRTSRVRYSQCWAFIRECMAAGIVEVHQPVGARLPHASIADSREPLKLPIARSTASSRLFARLVAYFG